MSKEEHGVANGGYRLGNSRLQPSERRLMQAGKIHLLCQLVRSILLIVLVENSQQLVSKKRRS
jgi:hypothetical protein